MRNLQFLFFLIIFCISSQLYSQASFAVLGTAYTENFNSLPNVTDGAAMAGWANNTSVTGLYASLTPLIESSTASMSNTGAVYVVASGADRNFGSRASGGTGTCYYGMRFVNNTGTTITSIYVSYFGEQWSIAENQTNVNAINVDYQVAATVTSLTAGAWTNVPGLTFTQIYTSSQSAGMGGSACGGTAAQCLSLNGNAAANRIQIQACITVSVPAGDEIMFRWVDVNDPANDHHMQIDDVSVTPYDISCAIILPVELMSFTGNQVSENVKLDWSTASETNNHEFTIERAGDDGVFRKIGAVPGNGTSTITHSYSFIDGNPNSGNNYYRLTQIDFNGQSKTYSPIVVLLEFTPNNFIASTWNCESGICYSISESDEPVLLEVFDSWGNLVHSRKISNDETGNIPMEAIAKGIYILKFSSPDYQLVKKVFR